MSDTTTPTQQRHTDVDLATRYDIERFLYLEAELLDDQKFEDWLELFDDDIHYWLPTRTTRTVRERDLEIAGPDGAAFFDDDKAFLTGRVRRLASGRSWSEEPPSRTRRLITNIRPTRLESGEFEVRVNFHVLRSRAERHHDTFFGERTDLLRRIPQEPGFHIARRRIVLDTTTLLAPSISIFL
ncbi:aromatic-ring-hydroxylating dioxygenase subunit beta [Embleya hyalina]|uniref:Putative biphenyl dioxygenase beta subunit n=1 Tax=Embleya hyalina TaxID=516124 RepID=A0A401YT56_9ACTN|nr:aromatic-ring-hydroxylating dioxygenase subunit beta [Embleya hyalina]GCD97774.1 putative biphenyl dioxygenase beta subunit [Embleya hyalina]